MSNYLIEFSVIHLALITGYWLFLKKEQQHAILRYYLLSATFLSLIIPLLKLPKLFYGIREPIDAIPMEAISLDTMPIAPATYESTWYYDLLTWMYIGISVLFLFKFFRSVLYLIYLERNSNKELFNDLNIRKVRNIRGSFTFFNWIFLSDEINTDQKDYEIILEHEKAHAALGHTFDLMFFELFKVCFWWHPTAWIINKEIRIIHEYQADAYALKSCNIDQYSSILIISTLKSNGLSLASSFHDGLILKRLNAMKQNAKNVSLWKLIVLCSIYLALIVIFACSEEPSLRTKVMGSQTDNPVSELEEEVFTVVEEWAQYPGGIEALYKYVANEIKYPKEARTQRVEGRVFVQFIVEKDGSLSDVKVVKGIGPNCDNEAVRVLQNAASFKPATQRGMAVRVRMVLPITFKLERDKTNEDNSPQGIIIVEEVQHLHINLKVDADYTNGEWSGTVFDENGEGLPGANIVVAGTTNGTVSDLDGTFKVKANESQYIAISFVGYQSLKLQGK
ncbi:MAG: TonB family protein [Bacteroidetes bacterium]|nr:TonB family protein [Bacteroidota bacterium]MDA1120449.1 TonB family protein [Bacteroidota bacterium]